MRPRILTLIRICHESSSRVLITRGHSIHCHVQTTQSKIVSLCTTSKMSTAAIEAKVYVTRRVPICGVETLRKYCDVTQWDNEEPIPRAELLQNVKGKNGLFCLLTDKIDAELLDAAGPSLKVVSTISVGYDHIDVAECAKRNIRVGFTPDVLTNATAELTVALLLATGRRLKEGIDAVLNGSWGTWNPIWLCGQGLDGATVGIIGLGRIGFAVAQRLVPFGVKQIIYSEDVEKDYAAKIPAEFVSLNTLLETSDFVLGCCALTKENMGLLNAQAFKKMKKNAVLINTSRGGLVNQDDLYAALKTGEIAAAGLDVTTPEPLPTNHPLLTLPNCLILPHIASATNKARDAMSELTARNIVAALNGEPMPAQVK